MKKIKILIALTFILGFLSCSDSFLDIKPLSIFTPESIYTDETGFKGVLVTLRKNLRFEFYGQVGAIGCEIISSDMAIAANKGADAMHNYDTQLLPTGTGSTYNFFELWDVAYNQIRMPMWCYPGLKKRTSKTKPPKKKLLRKPCFTVPTGTTGWSMFLVMYPSCQRNTPNPKLIFTPTPVKPS